MYSDKQYVILVDVMFSDRPPGGYIVNINIVIISANITHISMWYAL